MVLLKGWGRVGWDESATSQTLQLLLYFFNIAFLLIDSSNAGLLKTLSGLQVGQPEITELANAGEENSHAHNLANWLLVLRAESHFSVDKQPYLFIGDGQFDTASTG